MNKIEYADYQQAVDDFMERETLAHRTSGHLVCPNCKAEWDDSDHCPTCGQNRESFDEPYFSWSACDCCGSQLGGDREHATGYDQTTGEIREYSICSDCVYYTEYGRLDDMTMMEVESSTN